MGTEQRPIICQVGPSASHDLTADWSWWGVPEVAMHKLGN